jgi:hypothetical protein
MPDSTISIGQLIGLAALVGLAGFAALVMIAAFVAAEERFKAPDCEDLPRGAGRER